MSRLSPLALSLVLACNGTDAALDTNVPTTDAVDAPLGAYRNLVLTATPAVWGGVLTLQVTGGNPGETVTFVSGKNGTGQGPCPAALGGMCFDVANAKSLGSAIVGASGVAELSYVLPAGGPANSSITYQAAIARGAGGATSVFSDAVILPVATTFVDQFDFVAAEVDILLIVDDSCSMSAHQNTLASSFPTLLDELQVLGVDFHIGAITTDTSSANPNAGQLREVNGVRWVTNDMASIGATLRDMVLVGTNGSANERGLDAMEEALEPGGLGEITNAGFERPEAQLAVVVVTDENDSSNRGLRYYTGLLTDRKEWHDTARMHTLVGLGACAFPAGGNEYQEIAMQTGGAYADICDPDFTGFLQDVADTLYTSEPMFLTVVPAAGATSVVAEEPGGVQVLLTRQQFEYDATLNAVRTTGAYVPPEGTVFTISY